MQGEFCVRYSIGVVSRMLSMTTVALHSFKKEGIIDTPKEESGLRDYEKAVTNRRINVKKYREMDVRCGTTSVSSAATA